MIELVEQIKFGKNIFFFIVSFTDTDDISML